MHNRMFAWASILILGFVFLPTGCGDGSASPTAKTVYDLPEQNRTIHIFMHELAVGESGYMYYWSLWTDKPGNLFLHEQEEVYKTPPDAESFKVIHEQDGFHIDLNGCTHKWTKSDYDSLAGSNNTTPVVGIEPLVKPATAETTTIPPELAH
jgi:hypothetical protein